MDTVTRDMMITEALQKAQKGLLLNGNFQENKKKSFSFSCRRWKYFKRKITQIISRTTNTIYTINN